ncbi:MAG: hypothetical protein QME51_11785, partial [Planctomycetota bacterium]|nr:hypothetical protein [Planctomycetota bacterium]
LRKKLPTQKDVKEQVIDPLIEWSSRYLIPPDYVSKSGVTAEEILEGMKKEAERYGAGKYLKEIDRACRTVDGVKAKRIKDRLPLAAAAYAVSMAFGAWRLSSPLRPQTEDPLTIILGYLSGRPEASPVRSGLESETEKNKIISPTSNGASELLREEDELISGSPCLITSPERLGRFRSQLHNLLKKAFRWICTSNYRPDAIKRWNDEINQLATDFREERFAPFTTGGASHIDFVIHPTSAEFRQSPRFNAIRQKIYRFFFGEPLHGLIDRFAGLTASKTSESTGLNPADCIGGSIGLKKHYVELEMHLDISVAVSL